MKVEIECCEGNEKYKSQCLKTRCPVYSDARSSVDRSWPYTGTGFGNLYGNPGHDTYLSEVREALGKEISLQNKNIEKPEIDASEAEYLRLRDEEREPMNFSDYM